MLIGLAKDFHGGVVQGNVGGGSEYLLKYIYSSRYAGVFMVNGRVCAWAARYNDSLQASE